MEYFVLSMVKNPGIKLISIKEYFYFLRSLHEMTTFISLLQRDIIKRLAHIKGHSNYMCYKDLFIINTFIYYINFSDASKYE